MGQRTLPMWLKPFLLSILFLFTVDQVSADLLKNSGFENDVQEWHASAGREDLLAVVASAPHTGSKCVQLAIDTERSAPVVFQDNVSVEPSATYEVTAYARGTGGARRAVAG